MYVRAVAELTPMEITVMRVKSVVDELGNAYLWIWAVGRKPLLVEVWADRKDISPPVLLTLHLSGGSSMVEF